MTNAQNVPNEWLSLNDAGVVLNYLDGLLATFKLRTRAFKLGDKSVKLRSTLNVLEKFAPPGHAFNVINSFGERSSMARIGSPDSSCIAILVNHNQWSISLITRCVYIYIYNIFMYMLYVSSVVFLSIGRPGPILRNNLYVYIYKIVVEYRGSICSFFSCGERIKNSRGKKPRIGQNFLKISVCWSILQSIRSAKRKEVNGEKRYRRKRNGRRNLSCASIRDTFLDNQSADTDVQVNAML